MDFHLCRFYYDTTAKIDEFYVRLRRLQNIRRSCESCSWKVYIKDKRYSYDPGVRKSNFDSTTTAVHYKSTTDQLERMAEHYAIKKKNKSVLRKTGRGDVQIPADLREYRLSSLQIFEALEINWDGQLYRINVGADCIFLGNDHFRVIHFAPGQTETTMSKLAAEEVGRMIDKRGI